MTSSPPGGPARTPGIEGEHTDTDADSTTVRRGLPFSTPAPSREPRLVVLSGSQKGHRIPVESEVLVGRSDNCQLRLRNERASRQHARIHRTTDGEHVVEDLASRNGTFVNGRKVQRHVLEPEDRIQIGDGTTLLFRKVDPEEERASDAQKMQMLGRLGAGIAHDFNNVLAVIMSTMEYLRSLPADAPLSQQEVSECIEDVMAAAEHGAGVVSRITATLRRRSPGSMEVVDLSSVCQDTVRLVSRTFPRSMHVEQDIEPSLFVRAEAGALHQLVLNLCINARDAMQDQGCLRVRIQGKSGCELVGMPLDTTGQYCALSVEDTGPGMDEYTAQHVFEPLFTTKHTGGTGLGLSTVQEIARAHGGHIEVDSSVGYGTRVTVYLPRTEAAPEDPDPKADDPDPVKPGRGRGQSGDERKPRIVLVDDEELVVKSTARLLRRAGFEVEVALGGRPAIRLIQEDKQFDLVVLDFDMPDLSGEACHRELNQIAPGLRTVYLSGHADADREQVARELGALAFVRKPCDSTDLVATLRAALSAGSPASNSTTS